MEDQLFAVRGFFALVWLIAIQACTGDSPSLRGIDHLPSDARPSPADIDAALTDAMLPPLDGADTAFDGSIPIDAIVPIDAHLAFDANVRLDAHVQPDANTAIDSSHPSPDSSVVITNCAELSSCGTCTMHRDCAWCSSRATCASISSACVWGVREIGDSCGAVEPCTSATCWQPTADLAACGTWSLAEDFSSGRYAIHRYAVRIEPGNPVDIELMRSAGMWQPALLITDDAGTLVYAGETTNLHPSARIESSLNGRTGALARLTLQTTVALNLRVHVTSWAVLDTDFAGMVSTTAQYELSMQQSCMTTSDLYGGIERDGMYIPRAGLENPTLRGALGISVEPYGDLVTAGGNSWVRGTLSWFGGPRDTGVTATETGSISGEILRSLNNPMDPSASVLAERPEDYYYVAMRWNYSPRGVTWWRSARLLVRNPTTGATIVVRPVDWGPNTSTRRIIDLSPQSLRDLGMTTDDPVLVAFALPGTPLGPVD
jgi:hypothetical protein